MNKIIKYYGVLLVCFSFITIIFWVSNLISSNYSSGSVSVGLPIMIIAFVLFFFPGIYYFKTGKTQLVNTRATKSSFVIGIISFILLAISLFVVSIFIKDGESASYAAMYTILLSSILYVISIIIMIVGNTLKKKI